MGIEPRDLGALEKAVNEAAGRASGLWISFVFFATLIVITTGTVTHKHLFLELPLKLPVLNVELPLIGYFVAVPLFFVVFHFYVLLQLDGLAAKIEDYNAMLRAGDLDDEGRRLVRQRLDSFIFAQILVGARDRREGRIGSLNRAVAWITMVGLPIGTLLLLQLIFLPYHRESVTWWHRVWVLIDLGLIWFFWGRVAGPRNAAPLAVAAAHRLRRFEARALAAIRAIRMPQAIQRLAARPAPGSRRAALVVTRKPVVLSAAIVLFTTLVAAYPTEWTYTGWFQRFLWSNSLALADADLGVEEKLVAFSKAEQALASKGNDQPKSALAKRTLLLGGRDLFGATLDRVDLRQVDFRDADMRQSSLQEAQLQGADLSYAKLQGADLIRAQLQGADFTKAELQGAKLRFVQLQDKDLSQASLQGADLIEAQLQGAALTEAQLQGADLTGAQLQGADLTGARLQGAKLHGAQLQDADLTEAQLQGADLSRAQLEGEDFSVAQLQGADLTRAQLQGADLTGAQLQGADLSEAQLQGANLTEAQLQGADLSDAQLQGANLTGAQLQGAKLTDANVYRTRCPRATANAPPGRCLYGADADVRDVDVGKSLRAQDDGTETEMSPAKAFRKFVNDVLGKVPTEAREEASRRLSELEPGARTPQEDARLADRWRQERLRSLSPSRRAHIVARLACGAEGAPHVARGLLGNGRLWETGHHLHDIAAQMRAGKTDASKCAGVTGFDDEDWQNLEELVAEVPPKPDAGQSGSGK